MEHKLNGIINVYKEQGFTSHDVVARLRGILKMKKIGHTGTLDPDAEGVLPVCVGNATKLCDFLTDKTKEYEAVLLLGKRTDTLDGSGTVISENLDWKFLSEEEIRAAIAQFTGTYGQIPPMYSARKVNGKKLYELAREGIEIPREPRTITIYSIEIQEICLPRIRMRVNCSKGTYIRTLCDDIGQALSCGGCMEHLLRTATGGYTLQDSLTLSQIEEMVQQGDNSFLMDTESALQTYPLVYALPSAAKYLDNGNPLEVYQIAECPEMKEWKDGVKVRVRDDKERFRGIYEYQKASGRLKVDKLF